MSCVDSDRVASLCELSSLGSVGLSRISCVVRERVGVSEAGRTMEFSVRTLVDAIKYLERLTTPHGI